MSDTWSARLETDEVYVLPFAGPFQQGMLMGSALVSKLHTERTWVMILRTQLWRWDIGWVARFWAGIKLNKGMDINENYVYIQNLPQSVWVLYLMQPLELVHLDEIAWLHHPKVIVLHHSTLRRKDLPHAAESWTFNGGWETVSHTFPYHPWCMINLGTIAQKMQMQDNI